MPQKDQTILGSLLESLGSGEKQRFRRWLVSETRGRITHSIKLFDQGSGSQCSLFPAAL